ncbi:MAG: ABC transporter ATP-binding protein [Desulfurococcaceae archaeon]
MSSSGKAGESPVVEMRGIVKVYPDGTRALQGVDFVVFKGEIHGLLGENGAGKTTLMKILAGILRPTRGTIWLEGRRVEFRSSHEALSMGIGMVAQYPALVPTFTARENIFMGLPRREVDDERLKSLIKSLGYKIDLDAPIEALSMGLRQKVEIVKMLYRNVKVLILDEPTTNLTPAEVEELFEVLRKLKERGITIIFISHKLREVLKITDRITVLRRGLVTGVVETSKTSALELAKLMVGREVELAIEKGPARPGRVALRVEGLQVLDDRGLPAVKGVSFEAREGEIFGIAGVEGNGQRELVEAITGLRPPAGGRVVLYDVDVTGAPPQILYGMGLAHIPEDRVATGLVVGMSVVENALLGLQRDRRFVRSLGVIAWDAARGHVAKLIDEYGIVAPSLSAPARSLSGGNQQRLVVAREMSKSPRVVVAANPTRGLDVASTEFVRRKLVEMRDSGKAVLLVSADLDEVLQLSDRIAVMYEGKIMGVVEAREADEKLIGLMMGGYELDQAKKLLGR